MEVMCRGIMGVILLHFVEESGLGPLNFIRKMKNFIPGFSAFFFIISPASS